MVSATVALLLLLCINLSSAANEQRQHSTIHEKPRLHHTQPHHGLLESELNASNWGYKLDDWYRSTVRNVTSQPAKYPHSAQGVQDLILNKIFQFIAPQHKYFVEFGFDAADYKASMGANTASLYEQGWNGLLLDREYKNSKINLHTEVVTPANIVSLLEKYNVPYDVDYISIDIDSVDAFVFFAILQSKYRPAVISSEYNCLLPLYSNLCSSGVNRTSGEPFRYTGHRVFGSSILPLKTTADMFGYSIVAVDLGLDVFFVRNDLLNATSILPYDHWGIYTANYTVHPEFGTSISKPRNPYNKCWTEGPRNRALNHTNLIDSYFVRFDEWLRNGHNLSQAAGPIVFEEIDRLHIVLDRHVP